MLHDQLIAFGQLFWFCDVWHTDKSCCVQRAFPYVSDAQTIVHTGHEFAIELLHFIPFARLFDLLRNLFFSFVATMHGCKDSE